MARARGAVVSAGENICTWGSNYHFVSAYEVIFILLFTFTPALAIRSSVCLRTRYITVRLELIYSGHE